ncbi:hypothetical protein [Candidatus Nitronereus thalassa]|uniref:Lipoprotein n=1 Tax=Candidatus Nitronereus thalassa TaxID=3020898 RepID=A0ABU3KCQ4_9BACT|nr:hypothetical protein [Candidatus Nitronereus thalassa]MDT7044239.1 hypothetical protein [Candidatus Nitronereus thalassa]
MNSKHRLLTSAALTGLLLAAGCAHHDSHGVYGKGGSHAALGQCHGVNACKGKGDCASATHDCSGENSCEGKGWIKMSKAMCGDIKGSTWKAMPENMKHKG